jgi:rod shape-determining protein MreD
VARRAVFTGGLIVLCAALQVSVLGDLPLRPGCDLLLAVVVIVGVWSGPRAGMAAGFTAGVLQGALLDLDGSIGIYAAAKTIIGYLAGAVGRRVFAENLLVPAAAAAVLTFVHEAIVGVFIRPAGLWAMAAYSARSALYNGGAALLLGAVLAGRVRHLLPPTEEVST